MAITFTHESSQTYNEYIASVNAKPFHSLVIGGKISWLPIFGDKISWLTVLRGSKLYG